MNHRVWVGLVLVAGALLAPRPAAAQSQGGNVSGLLNLLMPGGYAFTSASARSALGNPKFYSEGQMLNMGVNVGLASVSGGIKIISMTDHYLPFSGGNQLDLFGPSATVSTLRVQGIRPFASAGMFAGHLHSQRLGIDKWAFTPGLAAGVNVAVGRSATLTAQYRFQQHIAGIDTNGVAVTLRFF